MQRKNKGNATVEFVVGAVVLVPLVAVIPVIGKLTDINHASEQAGRYAVWERTVSDGSSKSAETIENEVRNRFYATPDKLIKTEEAISGSVNEYWTVRQPSPSEKSVLFHSSTNGISLNLNNHAIPDTMTSTLSESIETAGELMSNLIPDARWDLDGKGFYKASIVADINTYGLFPVGESCVASGSEGSVCLKKHNAIFVDEWSAGSSAVAESRTRSMVPGGIFKEPGNIIANIGKAVPIFKELKKTEDIFGMVRQDVIPEGRFELE